MVMPRKRKYSTIDTFFGRRTVVFVKFPMGWTGHKVADKLFWAKRYEIVNLYDGFVIKCSVKPRYLRRFVQDNSKYLLWHKHLEFDDETEAWEVEDTIYD